MSELVKTIEDITNHMGEAIQHLINTIELINKRMDSMNEQVQSQDRRLTQLEGMVYDTNAEEGMGEDPSEH